MSIPDFVKANFATLLRAAAAGDLALVQGTDARTGEIRFRVGSEPLLQQGVRRLWQLLQRRYQL